ncbi:MAG: YbaK/EbsC family protein [Planctomycetales bacterium]|nr:YbaK/EbsC family protein [Planctomycetales bacterium]
MNVQQYLANRKISFTTLPHEETFTAQRLAQAVHVAGDEVAKTVLLVVDDDFTLAVLPSTHQVDLLRLKKFLGARRIEIADEQACGERFADCELGALPPFGSEYGMRTLLDKSLLEDEWIVFEGNTHHEAIRMRADDYVALEDPIVAEFVQRM